MRSALQLLGGVAVAGIVAAGSTAFTGSGLTAAGAVNKHESFLGGTVTQTVNGAAISNVAYTLTTGNTVLTAIVLTFSDNAANGSIPTLAATTSGGSWANATPGVFTCVAVASASSTCTLDNAYTLGTVSSLAVSVY